MAVSSSGVATGSPAHNGADEQRHGGISAAVLFERVLRVQREVDALAEEAGVELSEDGEVAHQDLLRHFLRWRHVERQEHAHLSTDAFQYRRTRSRIEPL